MVNSRQPSLTSFALPVNAGECDKGTAKYQDIRDGEDESPPVY